MWRCSSEIFGVAELVGYVQAQIQLRATKRRRSNILRVAELIGYVQA